jgi:hypothetical protein
MKKFIIIILYGYKDYSNSWLFAIFWGIVINIILWGIIISLINLNK